MSIIDHFARKGAELSKASQLRRKAREMEAQLAANAKQDAGRLNAAWQELIEASVEDAQEALEEQFALLEEDQNAAVDAVALVYCGEDSMHACVCLLPPLGTGKEADRGLVAKALAAQGVVFGIDQAAIDTAVAQKRYLRFIAAAKGTSPEDGADGRVTPVVNGALTPPWELYPKGYESLNAETVRGLRKGGIVCHIKPATAGRPGSDVRGRVISCLDGVMPELPMGPNLCLSEDGRSMVAAEDGILYKQDNVFGLYPTVVLDAPLTSYPAMVEGDLLVNGNLGVGVKMRVIGNMLVLGELQGAEIQTGGHLRVQKGIHGGRVTVGGSLFTPGMDNANGVVDGEVHAERILNCTLTCAGRINATSGEGVIAGGAVSAQEQITCIRLGSAAQKGSTQVSVGYSADLVQLINKDTEDIAKIRETLEKLRKSIAGLRMGGETLSLEKRALLERLTEQRDLYENLDRQISARCKDMKEQLRRARVGRIVCQELYPKVVAYIGDCRGEFNNRESKCNMHVYMGEVMVK